MKKYWILFALSALFLGGCQQSAPPRRHVVTEISVAADDWETVYNHQEKMEVILTYIRLMEPSYVLPAAPDPQPGPMYRISLVHSDGSRLTYVQQADRYFCSPTGQWRAMDPNYGALFPELLQLMPPDPPAAPVAMEQAGKIGGIYNLLFTDTDALWYHRK